MNRIIKIFNKLIQYKLSSQFGEVLLDCKLIGRDCGIGEYRYDLLFIFDKQYNNRGIQFSSVLETCDELFDWIDLTIIGELSIVIMNRGSHHHYSYFELMDEIHRITPDARYRLNHHPKYGEYCYWKNNRDREERMKRVWEMEMGRVTRNDTIQQSRIEGSRKKKFLFW
jgi:hypothetical protein